MINGVFHPTGDPTVELTCYAHSQAPKLANVAKRPAVLILPGGAYEHCSEREGEPVALAFLGAGYQAFRLVYSTREASAWPKPLTDVEAALRTIIEHADEWGVDTSAIVVAGFSAGGHLAAATGLYGSIRPAGMILIYPVTTRSTLQVCALPSRSAPDLISAIGPDTPPTFLAHTASDDLVPVTDSLVFAEALSTAHVGFELHIFPLGKHGLSLGTAFTSTAREEMENPVFAQWLGLALGWMQREFPVS